MTLDPDPRKQETAPVGSASVCAGADKVDIRTVWDATERDRVYTRADEFHQG